MTSVSRGPGSFLASFLALTAIVAGASGCTSTDAGPRLAANLGTRICIVNSWTETVNVTYDLKDTSIGEGDIRPGYQSCAEGTRFDFTDVGGDLVLPDPAQPFEFSATNPWFGAPYAHISQREDPSLGYQLMYHLCTSESGFDVGATRLWDNGTMRITIKRLPDDQWKEFTLVIEPSQGQRVGNDPCQGGSG